MSGITRCALEQTLKERAALNSTLPLLPAVKSFAIISKILIINSMPQMLQYSAKLLILVLSMHLQHCTKQSEQGFQN